MGVRGRIILILLCVSLGALTIAAMFAFTNMNDLGSYATQSSESLGLQAVNDSSTTLMDVAENSLVQLATDQAAISNQIFEQVRAEINTMALYAEQNMAEPSPTEILHIQGSDDPPPITVFATGVVPADIAAETLTMTAMDQIFVPIYHADPRITLVYTGSSSGMVRMYPGFQEPPAGYDPGTRAWFTNAVAAGDVIWSAPYDDALGNGLMVTCARPVHDPEGHWIWVVAADVTLQTIDKQIINTQVGTTGYAFLIDHSGNVISGPDLTDDDLSWNMPVSTRNLFNSSNTALQQTAGKMVAGETGIQLVEFHEGATYIAYAPIESTGWSVGVMLPCSEVIAPAVRTREQIIAASDESVTYIADQIAHAQYVFVCVFVLLVLAIVLVSRPITRVITDPLDRLKEGADAIGRGDLDYQVQVSSGDEFELLAGSFNTMAGDLRTYMDELRRTTAEKERIGKELEIAKEIQESFLPDHPPRLPGIDIAARTIPAFEVGGDFYDFIEIADQVCGLVIADVSGKGVPAALFMALSRTLIRANAEHSMDPVASIESANGLICRDAQTSMFVTVFYAILDAKTRTFTYVNAGHNPPLLVRGDTGEATLLRADGIALGVVDDLTLESIEIEIASGDLCILYTDGVTEAMSGENEEFGEDRLREIATRHRSLDAASLLDMILDEINTHAGSQPQHDDITMIVLKFGENR